MLLVGLLDPCQLETEPDVTPGRDGAAWLAADHEGFELQGLAESSKSIKMSNTYLMDDRGLP